MKKIILSLLVVISSFSMISCLAMEDITYYDEYVIGTRSYPVYYINSYPYYWFEDAWIMIPSYRYTYIRHIDRPRHIHAYRPNPHDYRHGGHWHKPDHRFGNYNGHRPNNGVPHTRQPNIGGSNNHSNHNGHRPSGGSNHGHFGSRR